MVSAAGVEVPSAERRPTVEDEWEVVSTISSIASTFSLVPTFVHADVASCRDGDGDEAEDDEAEAEDDDDDDDRLSTISVSTRNGYPALGGGGGGDDEDPVRGGGAEWDQDDNATASTAMPPLSFKEALLRGSGGLDSAKARSLQRAPTRLRRVSRKPRKPRPAADDAAADPLDPLDDEFLARKAHGSKRYRLRAPAAAAAFDRALRAPMGAIAEEDDAGSDDDGDDDYFD